MGHENIRTTFDLYGHVEASDEAVDLPLIEAANRVRNRRPKPLQISPRRRGADSNRCMRAQHYPRRISARRVVVPQAATEPELRGSCCTVLHE